MKHNLLGNCAALRSQEHLAPHLQRTSCLNAAQFPTNSFSTRESNGRYLSCLRVRDWTITVHLSLSKYHRVFTSTPFRYENSLNIDGKQVQKYQQNDWWQTSPHISTNKSTNINKMNDQYSPQIIEHKGPGHLLNVKIKDQDICWMWT